MNVHASPTSERTIATLMRIEIRPAAKNEPRTVRSLVRRRGSPLRSMFDVVVVMVFRAGW